MTSCSIIGISDRRDQWFSPEIMALVSGAKVFSGGKRHHQIMERWLPEEYTWIDITVPLNAVFEQYENLEDVVIFVSGDPLFYGFAATVQRECPGCAMKVYPSFNSLQMLAHRMNLPYQDMHAVSLTGRPWDRFDEALISGKQMIGCLTDKNKTPRLIWERMQEYGYSNYKMTVGQNLGNEQDELVEEFNAEHEYSVPNCIILQKTGQRNRPFGIPEQEFNLLDGRAKMITKMPVRLLSMSMLDLNSKASFWDIGFCTGSVSIEAKLQYPHLSITAFEIREQGRELMLSNSRKFGTPGINTVIGDFMSEDLNRYPRPDAVFIGGHGGKLREMILKIKSVMNPNCCIVFNSVSDESRRMFEEAVCEAGLQITANTLITIDDHNPIRIFKAQ